MIFSTKTVSTSDLPTGTASSTSKPCPTIPTTPKDADPDSLYHSLSYREAQLCRQLKMKPSVFIQASTSLEDECKRRNGLIEKEAAAIVSWFNWIPSQWTQFWGFLLRWGYVWLRHTGKRRRRPAEGEASDDEGPTLFPAIPFCRTVEEANRAAADVYRSLYSMDADGASIADSEEGTRGRPPPSSGFRASPNNYRNVGLGRAPPKKIKVTTADMLVVQMTDGARYRMICPTCGKRHFNNLQGFVNHCRISHNLYFPSHADAVLKCGEKLEGGGVKQEGQNDAAEEHAEPTIAAVENEGGVLNGSLSAKMLLYRKKPAGTVSLKRTRQDGKFARVVCPNCGRNDFLSMQGFLKHLNMHGIFVTVPEAIELYGVVNEEAEVASLPADAEPTVTVTAPDDAENGESSNAAAAEPEPSEPPRPPLVGVDPTDLVIRKADGNYVKVVCPDCGRSNFANLQVFVHHLAVSHDGTFESLEQYSQPLKIAKPPAARPPPLPGTNFKLKFKFKVPKMSLPVQQRFAHTPLGRSEGGSPPGSASGSPGYEQYTRSGGPRVAAGANFSPGGGRRPPPRPLDIDHLPDVDRLNEDEREICRTNRLVPQNYLSIKDLFVTECQKRGGLGKRSAREMVKMDVNKSSKIWEYLQMQGLVWPPSGSKN